MFNFTDGPTDTRMKKRLDPDTATTKGSTG